MKVTSSFTRIAALRKLILLPVLICDFVSCGQFSESRYIEGSESVSKNGSNQDDQDSQRNGFEKGPENSPKDSQIDEDSDYLFFSQVEGSTKRVTPARSVDTGLDACVREKLVSEKVSPYVPAIYLEGTSGDGGTVSEFQAQAVQDLVSQLNGNRAAFDNLLDGLLSVIVNNEGLVNYAALADDGVLVEPWKALVLELGKILPAASDSEAEKVSFWVNAYNVSMIEILRVDPQALSSPIKRDRVTFGGKKSTIGGQSLSLNQIEYGILKLASREIALPEFDQNLFPAQKYPALHVALVCGALSCPKLRRFAYRAESLNQVLDENLFMFWNNKTKHFVASEQGYQVSSLLSFFTSDFELLAGKNNGNGLESLPQKFVIEQCRADKAQLVAAFSGLSSYAQLVFLPYDWSKNSL